MTKLQQVRFVLKPLVFVACLLPFLWVVTDLFELTGSLGANPVEAMLDRFGVWSIRFIMIALAVTPLRRLTGWNWLSRFRRMLGLFAFFYVMLHFLVWLVLDQGLYLPGITDDIVRRPFITIGFAAFLLLSAMAATSTNAARRLLRTSWQKLHYGAYVVGVLAVWHYWWQVKADIREPVIYAAILGVLLGSRLLWRWRKTATKHGKSDPKLGQSVARPA